MRPERAEHEATSQGARDASAGPRRHLARLRRAARSLARRFRVRPPVGLVRFGSLRRVRPISADWGFDRGRPVDRRYIMEFLSRHRNDVRGRVLEVGGDGYTRIFGSDLARSDVVDRRPDNQAATIVADLSAAPQIPGGTYDCIIVTQTLQYIFDVRGAIATLHRILRPGGVVLATVPGITRINRYDANDTGEFWHLTSWSVRALFEEAFVGGSVEVAAYGNVLAAVALLHGISAGELRREELDARDPDFEVLVTVRGVKATQPPSPDAGT